MKIVQMGPMTTLKQRATRFGLGLGLAATLALGAVMPALAADPGVTITAGAFTATPGTIVYSIDGVASGATNTIQLDGHSHSIGFTVPVYAVDHSGNDLGWHTTFSLAAFTTGSVLLGEGALDVTAASSAACDTSTGQVCTTVENADGSVNNAVTPLSYTTGSGALTMFSTDGGVHTASYGMGQYNYDTAFTLALPRTAKAGVYSSTMAVSLVSAP